MTGVPQFHDWHEFELPSQCILTNLFWQLRFTVTSQVFMYFHFNADDGIKM